MRSKVAMGGLVGLVALASLAPISQAGTDTGEPTISLRRTMPSVVATKYGKRSPRIPIPVYVQALDAPLDLRVRRPSYKDPLTLYQVKHASTGDEWVELGDLADGWDGLRDFMRMRIRDDEGRSVFSVTRRFCPNTWERQRINDQGPSRRVFPDGCWGSDRSFLKGMAWGIEEGWAVPLSRSVKARIAPGDYQGSVWIRRDYRDLFGISDEAGVAKFDITVEKDAGFDDGGHFGPVVGEASETGEPSSPEDVPAGAEGPRPDLQALPAFSIDMENRGDRSRVEFAATIWTGGDTPLVVEGFRRPDEDTMDAYQYFYEDGEAVGREEVGTFEYDRRDGHFHWHFLQFASYQIRSVATGEVEISAKQSFCVVPTDSIDLSLDHASWTTEEADLRTSCGGEDALWIREVLPIGWGDTYSQVAGQAFNVTDLPNGEYWIEVEANPEGVLFESDMSNNLVQRKVVLGGEQGARTITVKNWHGVDW